MALIDDNKIKEVGLELTKGFFAIIAGKLLIQSHINFIGTIKISILHLCHLSTEGFKITGNGLIHKNITVCQKENLLLQARLPQTIDNLKGHKCFTGTCGADHKDSISPLGNCINGSIDRHTLIGIEGFYNWVCN